MASPKDVLVNHQRMDAGGCLCGWNELGKCHAEHVLQEFTKAGFEIKPIPGPMIYRRSGG